MNNISKKIFLTATLVICCVLNVLPQNSRTPQEEDYYRVLTLPVPDKSRAVKEEERAINTEMRMLANSIIADNAGALTGPWIEVWFRRQ